MEATKKLRNATIALAMGALIANGAASATSWSTDTTDIWWNPGESGWGVNMIQTGSLIFVTFYLYGADRKPVWFSSSLNAVTGMDNVYTGDLYATTGPYYGSSFNPSDVYVRKAGTATFSLNTVSSGTLEYTVDGVKVTKAIQRQPLTYDDYYGDYDVRYTYTNAGCNNPSLNGSVSGSGRVVIDQRQSSMNVDLHYILGDGVCNSSGTYSQLGRMGTFSGPYTCDWNEKGTALLYEMNNSPYIFTARMRFTSPTVGCTAEGEIVGVVPR